MSLKYDEAIKIMNEIKELPYLGARLMDWAYHNEAVDIAISSIEKQVPKKTSNTKAMRNFNNVIYSYRGDCPTCGCEDIMSCQCDYCRVCGQRLNWEVE